MKKLFLLSTIMMLFTLAVNAQKVTYNFNDSSWGEPVTERPESGSYTSSTVNDVKFTKAMLYQKDGKGQVRVLVDKSSQKSSIEFPEFTGGKKEVTIEASVGTEGRTLLLEEKKNGKWSKVSEIELTKSKAPYSIKISDKAKQIRIVNPTSSTLTIFNVSIQ